MGSVYNVVIFSILIHIIAGYKSDEIFIDDESKDVRYFEHVTKSRYFVDKSNLLKTFLQHERPSEADQFAWDNETRAVAFTCPKGFGKTTNLDMVRRFFQLPFNQTTGEKIDKKTTQNYKLFTNKFLNLEITRDENFIEQHFGEYPLMYLDFANIQGATTDEIITSISKRIDRVLHSYRWLCKKVRKENENTADKSLKKHLSYFKKIFKKTANPDHFIYALRGVAELLAQHFGKKPIMVLIDNYDTPITYAITNNIDAKPIHNFMRLLIEKFVFYKVPCHLMMVGVDHSFLDEEDGMWLIAIQQNVFLSCSVEFGQYFGFTNTEVDGLLTTSNANTEDRARLKKHFNNYKFVARNQTCVQNISLYHPTGVLRYFQTNDIDDHCLSTGILVPQIMTCLKHETFFKWILSFLTKRVQTTFPYSPLHSSYLKHFVDIANTNCSQLPPQYIYETVLIENGYLSFADFGIQTPNVMAENQLKRDVNRYFFDFHGINITNSHTTTSIRSILNSRITTDEMLINLADSLQKMLNSSTTGQLNKFQFLSIIFATLINYRDFDQKLWFKDLTAQLYAAEDIDTFMLRNRDQKMAVVFKVLYNETLEKAINATRNYRPIMKLFFNEEKINLAKYIGINLDQMNRIQIGKGKNRYRS